MTLQHKAVEKINLVIDGFTLKAAPVEVTSLADLPNLVVAVRKRDANTIENLYLKATIDRSNMHSPPQAVITVADSVVREFLAAEGYLEAPSVLQDFNGQRPMLHPFGHQQYMGGSLVQQWLQQSQAAIDSVRVGFYRSGPVHKATVKASFGDFHLETLDASAMMSNLGAVSLGYGTVSVGDGQPEPLPLAVYHPGARYLKETWVACESPLKLIEQGLQELLEVVAPHVPTEIKLVDFGDHPSLAERKFAQPGFGGMTYAPNHMQW